MKFVNSIATRIVLVAGLLAASVPVAAQPVTEEELWTKGLDYILSEYALDAVSYTSCALTLAKLREPPNFAKVKQEFIGVFPPELRAKAENLFYSSDMAELKAKVAERGVMKAINDAKNAGKNMAQACENGIKSLMQINETARRDWNELKVRLN